MGTTPQTSDGYTRTANELMEAECKACLTGNEWRVYNAIKRLTYGWNKKEDRIAYSLIVELTNLAKNRVFEAVQSLIKKAVLLSRPTGTHSPQFLGINKNFESWKVSRSRGISRPSGTTYPAPAVQNYSAQGGPPKTVKKVKEKNYTQLAEGVVELWHTYATNLPKVQKITTKRVTAIKTRFKDFPTFDDWAVYFQQINQSAFLTGDNNNGWNCNLDWVLNESNMAKIIEGNYDDRESKQPQETETQQMIRMAKEMEAQGGTFRITDDN